MQTYDDNVFGTENPREQDSATIVEPSVAFSRSGVKSRQTLDYTFSFEKFWANSREDAFSHRGSYRGAFSFSPRLSADLQERVLYSPALSTQIFPESAAEPQFVRVRTLRSSTELTPSIRLGERSDLKLASVFFLWRQQQRETDPDVPTRSIEMYQAAGAMALHHKLNERDTLVPRVSSSYFWFSDTSNVLSVGGDFSWSRDWSPTVATGIGLGAVETLPRGEGSRSTNWTAGASGSYRIPSWAFRLAYARSLVSTSGFGTALIQDSVTLGVSFSVRENWSFSLDPGYFHSASAGAGEGGSVQGVFADAAARLSLRRGLAVSLAYRFRLQETESTQAPTFKRNLVVLTLSVEDFLELIS